MNKMNIIESQRVSAFDEMANEHFNKVNQLMLGK